MNNNSNVKTHLLITLLMKFHILLFTFTHLHTVITDDVIVIEFITVKHSSELISHMNKLRTYSINKTKTYI